MRSSPPINSASSCDIASLPTSHSRKSQVIESLSLEGALLVEFDTDTTTATMVCDTPATNAISPPDPLKRKRSVDISTPSKGKASELHSASISVAPLLWNISVPSDNQPGESYYCVVPPSKPTYEHPRLHSNEAVEAPRAVSSGSNLMATMRRLRALEICEEYPEYVTRSSLVLLFSHEGWTSHLIWNNIPSESRRWSPGGCPWSYIDDALRKQMDKLPAAEDQAGVDAEEEASENQDGSTPATRKFRPKTPNWNAADSAELLRMRGAGKTHKEIGEKLRRSEAACASRLVKLKKAQEAAAEDKAGEAAGRASDPLELEDVVEPGGQVDDPMVLD